MAPSVGPPTRADDTLDPEALVTEPVTESDGCSVTLSATTAVADGIEPAAVPTSPELGSCAVRVKATGRNAEDREATVGIAETEVAVLTLECEHIRERERSVAIRLEDGALHNRNRQRQIDR
jgi:hypothetical protein